MYECIMQESCCTKKVWNLDTSTHAQKWVLFSSYRDRVLFKSLCLFDCFWVHFVLCSHSLMIFQQPSVFTLTIVRMKRINSFKIKSKYCCTMCKYVLYIFSWFYCGLEMLQQFYYAFLSQQYLLFSIIFKQCISFVYI